MVIDDHLFKMIHTVLEQISSDKNWDREDCLCFKRSGGFWIGNPDIVSMSRKILTTLNANKNNKK